MSATNSSIVSPAPRKESAIVAWVKSHQLLAYFIWAFGATWLFAFPIAFSQRGLGLFNLPDALLLVMFLLATYVGPAPAAIIVTGITEGKAGVKRFLRRMVQWRVGLGWYLLVILGYPLVFLVGITLALGTGPLDNLAQNWPLLFTVYLPFIPFGMFYPGLGEEPGWRGFALPRLQVLYGPVIGSLILGGLHAIWHLPAYVIPGAISEKGFDLSIFVGNSLAIMAATIVWTWLFNNAGMSIFFAMFVHATSNAVTGFLPRIVHNTTGNPFFGFEVFAVVALLVIVFTRGRLSYRPTSAPQADRGQSVSGSLASQPAE